MLLFLWSVQKELSQISDENIWKAKQKSARSSKHTKILVNVLYLFLPEELHLGFYKQRSLLASAGAMLRWWMVCKEAADGGGILPGRGQSLNQESSRGGGHGQMVAAWTNERTSGALQQQHLTTLSTSPIQYKSDYFWTELCVLSCDQFILYSSKQIRDWAPKRSFFRSISLENKLLFNSTLLVNEMHKETPECYIWKTVTWFFL